MAGVNQILSLSDDLTRYLKACGKSSVLQTKPVNPSQLKGLRFPPEAIGDTLTRSPQAEVFANFSKKLATVKNSDDFVILSQEFNKLDLDDVMRQELITKYISKYESFYNKLYSGKTFEPKILFKQIFGKDLSEEVAQTLCSKYKEILAEPDFNKFLEQLFVQVKKDFELDYIESSLKKISQPGRGIAFSGGSSKFLDFTQFKFFEDNPMNRRKAFELMMHEINHLKQSEISIAIDPMGYINALAKNSWNNPEGILNRIGNNKISSIYKKHQSNPKDSPLYKRGMDYIKSTENYFSPKGDFTAEKFLAYKKQFNEAESYAVQDRAGELFYYLTGNAI